MPLDLGLLLGRQELADELGDERLRLGTQELVDDLLLVHGEHRRDRLHPEGCADLGVGVDVHLGQHHLAVGRHGAPDDRTQRDTAGTRWPTGRSRPGPAWTVS